MSVQHFRLSTEAYVASGRASKTGTELHLNVSGQQKPVMCPLGDIQNSMKKKHGIPRNCVPHYIHDCVGGRRVAEFGEKH